MSKLFWLGPNNFVQVQIRFLWTNFHNLIWTCAICRSNMIWTRPKKLDRSKMIGTQPKSFGPIEGQGMKLLGKTKTYFVVQMVVTDLKRNSIQLLDH